METQAIKVGQNLQAKSKLVTAVVRCRIIQSPNIIRKNIKNIIKVRHHTMNQENHNLNIYIKKINANSGSDVGIIWQGF